MSSATLQDDLSVESFFNVVETETLALFEHLSFEFLADFNVFAPAKTVNYNNWLRLCDCRNR
jgi:hypothetical protein